MSASRPCNMRGPRLKIPLLLFLLLTALTRTVLCDDEETETEIATEEVDTGDPDAGPDGDAGTPEPTDPGDTTSNEPITEEEDGSGRSKDDGTTLDPGVSEPTSSPEEGEEEGLSPIIILIPVVLVVVIIGMIVCGIFINRRWNNKARDQELRKEDPYLDGSSTEKVPMPMFEEDVPSVLELEMEELDQWIKKDDDTAEDSKQE
ncbi:transmembrane protein 154 isoform X2 [Notolabrus celidotus]|uniref:transmembrane protein 154 isoform X2 n=1 Tax=Notolabrus celidotus TaxID=1203425 RepID=UPI0014901455|nr:transmembrane protein 154 isoform X2 [Notolabrus celidotus]